MNFLVLLRWLTTSLKNVFKTEGYSKEESIKKTENIYNTTLEIFDFAKKNKVTTHRAAFDIAQQRIDTRKKEKNS